MQDMIAHLERLRSHAAQCAMIRNVTVDETIRDLFNLLAEQLDLLASEVERVITANLNVGEIGQ